MNLNLTRARRWRSASPRRRVRELRSCRDGVRSAQAKGSTGAWDEWMGIQLECQYEEDLTKQPEARVRWYEAAGGTTLWEMTTDPVRARRVLRCCGAFTLSLGLVAIARCRGSFLFRV